MAANSIYDGFAHAADLYAKSSKLPYQGTNSGGVYSSSTFLDPYGNTEDDYFMPQSFGAARVSRRLCDWIGDDPRINPPTEAWCAEPNKPDGVQYPDAEVVIGSRINSFTYVLKWDVLGGFKFIV